MSVPAGLSTAALLAQPADRSDVTPWPLIIVVGAIVALLLLIAWAQNTTPPSDPEPDPAAEPAPEPEPAADPDPDPASDAEPAPTSDGSADPGRTGS